MTKMLRYYALLSLVALLATAMLLTWYYRHVAIGGITQLVEHNNQVLARAALSPIRTALVQFLQATEAGQAANSKALPLPDTVMESIHHVMQDRSIVRIKIYNRDGKVAFSTLASQLGEDQRHNPGVVAALQGRVMNGLVYRDAFNYFDSEQQNENVIQTYIPIRASRAEAAVGVFELYTDVKPLVLQTERTEFAILAGSLLILASLYGVLILVVQRLGRVVEQQQSTIRDRTETLQLLSAQLLKNEEQQRKGIATELHEELAQNLAAIKLQVENGRHRKSEGGAGVVDTVIPELQQAIHKTRTIAKGLHPSSLDDFGLLQTLNSYFREYGLQHPDLVLKRQFDVKEPDIPVSLRSILYRIIVSVLEEMARQPGAGQVYLGMWKKNSQLILLAADTSRESLVETAIPLTSGDLQSRPGFARMEALTMLSGGEFSASRHAAGGTALHAGWRL